MKGTILITAFLIGGVLLGYAGWIPDFIIENECSTYVLYALLFTVGISIGADKELVSKLKGQKPSLLLIPVITIVGSLIGALVVVPFVAGRSVSDCLAVASGFGYYSLSSILITQYKGADLGVVALLSNIIREVSVLVFAPLMVRYFGKLAPICCGGATSMDSTLPIITRVSGNEFVLVAIIHGILVDFSVPFLVPFFCSL